MIFVCYECGKLLKENEVIVGNRENHCWECFAEYRDHVGFFGVGKSTKKSITKTLNELKKLEAKG